MLILNYLKLKNCLPDPNGPLSLHLRSPLPIVRSRRRPKTATRTWPIQEVALKHLLNPRIQQVLHASLSLSLASWGLNHYYSTLAIFCTVCLFVRKFFNMKINMWKFCNVKCSQTTIFSCVLYFALKREFSRVLFPVLRRPKTPIRICFFSNWSLVSLRSWSVKTLYSGASAHSCSSISCLRK